ncbi:MAG: hypothetical protein QG644_438 [Patescibacteria group bacterium]|nr:hypothetical protein [Patescibacteria group bacterium]
MLGKFVFKLFITINKWFPPWKLILTHYVLMDRLETKVNVVLVFGDVPGNATNHLFRQIALTLKAGLAEKVLINGLEAKEEFGQSAMEWRSKLSGFKVPEERILEFPPARNTFDEAKEMVLYAKQEGWRTAVILAQPHRLVRCLRCLIKAMEKHNHKLDIYFIYPKCDLSEKTAGSQNLFFMKRYLWIGWENSVFHSLYYRLPSFKKSVTYLENRK